MKACKHFCFIASVMMLMAILLLQGAIIPAPRALAGSTLSFTEHTIAGNFDGAYSVYATDMDGDGDVDVLGTAYNADDITWWGQGSIPSPTVASFPFYDGFEAGTLGTDWTTYTTNEGRVQVSSSYPYSGTYSLLLDDSENNSTYSYAAGILTIDLSGQSQVELDFWWREFNDESDADDGVFISDDDGANWYPVLSFNGGTSTWRHEVIDIDAEAIANGLTLNDHFQIKFQFYDNYSIVSDGYAIDEVRVQGESYRLHLPVVLKNAGPPSAPVLDPIDNSEGDGSYTISWSNVSGATGYVLQEDDNTSFASPTTVYSGASTSRTITGRDVGTYYYRVQATNSFGSSPWSNVVSVQVTQPGVVPQPGYWSGGTVSFEVTADSSTVHDFTAEVYVSGCGTYQLTWNDMAISSGQFSGGGVSGEFSTPTSASGSYSYFFEACNGWVFGFGSWSATWRHH